MLPKAFPRQTNEAFRKIEYLEVIDLSGREMKDLLGASLPDVGREEGKGVLDF